MYPPRGQGSARVSKISYVGFGGRRRGVIEWNSRNHMCKGPVAGVPDTQGSGAQGQVAGGRAGPGEDARRTVT